MLLPGKIDVLLSCLLASRCKTLPSHADSAGHVLSSAFHYSVCKLCRILGSNKGSVMLSGVVMHCGDARTILDVASPFAGMLLLVGWEPC